MKYSGTLAFKVDNAFFGVEKITKWTINRHDPAKQIVPGIGKALSINLYEPAPGNTISDILLQFSRENFYFGCTFWTFQNNGWFC
jgi:hypothetical protein